ncbi:polysaccharide pyruvyl transferase family protein [bacterium SPL81]|nr:polysaccharide pyruvyl transferase family protein [Acinetobacter baumannii]
MKIMLFAYLDNNIGDDLMLKLLSERFPNHHFYYYTSNTVVLNTLSQFENFVSRSPSQRQQDIDTVDGVLSIGGSIFNDLNTLRGKLARIRKILFIAKASRKGKLIATVGCNLGPYKDNLGWYLTSLELKFNSLITVRDRSSFDLLNTGSFKNFHIADDIVYSLSVPIDGVSRYGLGISAFRSTHLGENNYKNYVALATIIDKYIEQTNKKVRIFAFDSEHENDTSAALHIFNLSKCKENIEIVPYLGDINTFVNKFNQCEHHIAIRFHSAILSALMKIPFYPISYSNKMDALIEENYPEFKILNIAELDVEKIDICILLESLLDKSKLCYANKETSSQIHFEQLDKLWSNADNV